jgi:hypothetical protein
MLLKVCFWKRLIYSSDCRFLRAALTGGSDGDKFFWGVVTNLKRARRNVKRRYCIARSYSRFKQDIC